MQNDKLPSAGDAFEKFDILWNEALELQPFFRDSSPSPEQHQTTGHEILRAYLAAPENQAMLLAAPLAFEVQAGDYRLAGIVDRVDESKQARSDCRGLQEQDAQAFAQRPRRRLAVHHLRVRSCAHDAASG